MVCQYTPVPRCYAMLEIASPDVESLMRACRFCYAFHNTRATEVTAMFCRGRSRPIRTIAIVRQRMRRVITVREDGPAHDAPRQHAAQ